MFYLYMKFHMPLSKGLVDIINISKGKLTFCMTADVDFTEKEYLNRSYIFFLWSGKLTIYELYIA
jgi:hypothetical protein